MTLEASGENVDHGASVQDVTVTARSPGRLTDADRISQNTKVVAGKWIDIHGDYDAFTSGVTSVDPGYGL